MEGEVTLTPKGDRWARTGHPWVYRDDTVPADSSLSGPIVRVKASNGRLLGKAFYNATSKISLRWLTDDPDKPVDVSFWEARVQAALDYRQQIVRDSTAYRLIHSGVDGFPGLIVDRYGAFLVVQAQSLGADRILPVIVEILTQKIQPEGIVARNDSTIRALEGLPLEKSLIAGQRPDRVEVVEGNCRYGVDVWEGQKTGAYLDQRENRLLAASLARGRVLDAFAYQGGFSLQMAGAAEEVVAIEDSEMAVKGMQENVALNRLTNVRVIRDNAFDRLRVFEQEGERFDLVVLDPPAFAKSKQAVSDAWRGYREINLRALKILRPGGILISCSCSYNMSDQAFLEILREASQGAHRQVRLLETRTQAKDHPILLTHPESKYLKCFVLEVE